MCRLFGMSGGRRRVTATFWLLEAPDSLARQSRKEPDGTGLGYYAEDGHPILEKQPIAAYEDEQFAREAREACSATFIAHVRYASTGGLTAENTHPFEQDGRLFAHNGVIGDLPKLERELGPAMDSVRGDTDSERFFALISREIDRAGEVSAGISAAAQWIASELPVFSLNCIVITREQLWALRYPDVHDLFVLERAAGGAGGGPRHLEQASAGGSVRVRSGDLAGAPAVVVATERMDEDPGWRQIPSGSLLHVDADLRCTIDLVLREPPRNQLSLADLGERAAASQAPAPQAG